MQLITSLLNGTRDPDVTTVAGQQPMNELWDCTLQEVMTARDQSRKQPGIWPSFTKAPKDGSRKDVSQTANHAWPSAKPLSGSKLGQDVSARKLGFLVINQRWGDFRWQFKRTGWRLPWSWPGDVRKGNLVMYEPVLIWNLFLIAARLPGESLELTA